jgi:hypothetical protein
MFGWVVRDMSTNRTNGFTVYDAEVHAVLDRVSPNTERMYRKLLQRMNHKRGDREVFPSWKMMQSDCGFTADQLSKALKEAEHFRLISVERPSRADAVQKHAHNIYTLTSSEELPTGEILEGLLSHWEQVKRQKSEAEKERKAKKLLSQTEQATITEGVGLLSQTETNYDESNQDESNQDEALLLEKNDSEERSISVKEGTSLLEDISIPVKDTIFDPDLKESCASYTQNEDEKYPKIPEIMAIYHDAHGGHDERLMAVAAHFRWSDVEYLKSCIFMGLQERR